MSRTRSIAAIAALLALASCGGGDETAEEAVNGADAAPGFSSPGAPDEAETRTSPEWDLVSSGDGAALVFGTAQRTAMRLFCPAGGSELLVNVPAFRPIGSEERLSFGSGGEVVALVADVRGDSERGGVSATGAVPGNLAALIGGPVSASYGAQTGGPHPAPPAALARGFVAACADSGSSPPPPAGDQVSACLKQDGRRLDVAPRKVVGNEPFWGARIEGRCVTYSHPENIEGTRVWTTYSKQGGAETWSGALGDRLFRLELRPQQGCSDGMSDKRYPFAAELTVRGEQRRGCAEPV